MSNDDLTTCAGSPSEDGPNLDKISVGGKPSEASRGGVPLQQLLLDYSISFNLASQTYSPADLLHFHFSGHRFDTFKRLHRCGNNLIRW